MFDFNKVKALIKYLSNLSSSTIEVAKVSMKGVSN
jgi:hypothetical protein